MIQLYAITDHPGPPLPDLVGLEMVARRDLAAVWAPAAQGEVTADALWRYEQVVETLMRDRDLLPIRYGTRVPDERAASQALEQRYDELRGSLDRIRGAVELSVRALSTAASPAPAGQPESGTAYLRARADEAAAQADVVRRIHEPLAGLARAATLRSTRRAGERMCAAYLVDQAHTEQFSAAVTRLQDQHPTLALTCTGPWPAYSFAQP